MKSARRLVLAAGIVAVAACGPKPIDNADAGKLIGAAPELATPVDRLPLAADIVESNIGVDAGVIDGLWKYSGRDASNRPARTLTDKGKQYFKDTNGALAVPGRREIVAVTAVNEDKADKKHRTVDFTWRYQMPEVVQRYTGLDGTYDGHADLRYDGAWKVASVRAEAKPSPFRWNAALGADVRRLLSAEQEASTQLMLALEPQRFKAPGGKPFTVTVADVYVSVEDETSRRTVSYVDFIDCKVEESGGVVTLRFDGVRQSALATALPPNRADFDKLCATTKEARQTWAAHNPEVAARGPLGVAYSR